MCLKTSPPQENKSTILVAVMSSGESNVTVVPVTPGSSSRSPPQPSSLTMGKSESSERFRGDVASLDAVSIESEVGELKKESAQSAFEITSVEPAPDDDLDTTGRVQPASMDDSTLKIKLESGDSEEDSISLSEDQQHTPKTPTDVEPSASGPLSSSSGIDLSRSQQTSTTGNGPSVQPGGRFRKVNKYTRGRWIIRDMETTEERSGTEIAARHASQGVGSRINILEPGSGSPSAGRRTDQQESLHSRSGSELGQVSNASTITGGGAPSDNTSDKDSTSMHLDRSSTAADTLSRNTSMSSINALDDRSTDVDIDAQPVGNVGEVSETVTSTSASSGTVASHPPPHTSTLTSSSEGAAMTSTHQAREHPMSQLNGPLETEMQPSESENVKVAMAHLQKQLDVLLTSKTGMEQKNTQLHERIHDLQEKVKRLQDDNSKLRQLISGTTSGQQASQLQDRNRVLEEENVKLKNELMRLKSALSLLVKDPLSDSSVDASQGSAHQT